MMLRTIVIESVLSGGAGLVADAAALTLASVATEVPCVGEEDMLSC
jgi:hypothetical protein